MISVAACLTCITLTAPCLLSFSFFYSLAKSSGKEHNLISLLGNSPDISIYLHWTAEYAFYRSLEDIVFNVKQVSDATVVHQRQLHARTHPQTDQFFCPQYLISFFSCIHSGQFDCDYVNARKRDDEKRERARCTVYIHTFIYHFLLEHISYVCVYAYVHVRVKDNRSFDCLM